MQDKQLVEQSIQVRMAAVADARYLLRRAFRIIDEEARNAGLEPLEHQLIVQLRGVPTLTLTVTELASRLDIQLGLVSRLTRRLEERGFAIRSRSSEDLRVTLITATEKAIDLAKIVAERIRPRYLVLQNELPFERRKAAVAIWAGIFGVRDDQQRGGE
jgi:DNA-binding MarR family transcriptional regulator